jgi:O-antigen ligase
MAAVPYRRLAVFALAAALPLAPLAVATPAGHFSPVELLALGVLGLSALRLYWSGRLPGWRGAFAGPALLLAGAGILSLAVSAYPRLGLRELRTLVLEPALFYLCAAAALRDVRDARRLAVCFVAGAACAAAIALAQTATGRGLVAAEGVARAAALYPSPNNLALLLDRALPLAMALAIYEADDWRHRFASGAVCVVAAALFFTFSSGAWLASACAAAVVLAPAGAAWLRGRGRRARAALAAAGGIVVVAAVAAALRFGRLRASLRPEGTGALRVYLWESALKMARDHPIFGVGLDQFLYQYPRYMHPEAWREPGLSHPHNLLLDFWLRLGIAGLVFVAWVAVTVYRETRWLRDPAVAAEIAELAEVAPQGRFRAFGLMVGVSGSLVALAVHGMVDNSYFVFDLAYAFWILVLVLELCRRTRGNDSAV